MTTALVALGSNLGPREQTLSRAVEGLRATTAVDRVIASRWIGTDPVGGPAGQPAFLNGAARVETTLSAEQLHRRLKALEAELGRAPGERWGPRAIDLDLLLHGDERVATASLEVPHPRMAVRRFVLEPAVEVAPELVHPEIGWTIEQLWKHLLTAPAYAALVGGDTRLRGEVRQLLEERGVARLAADNTLRPDGPWLVRDDWRDDPAETPPPKLVVVLDDGSPAAREVERQARRRGRGPALTVDATDLGRAIDEIAAALDSMRP